MDIEINSWKDLQEHLFRDSWDPSIQRYRSSFIYRGNNIKDLDLTTSLQRLGGPYEKLEKHLLRNFRKYAHLDKTEDQSIWNWLALAQHHGLPTRLLDWTYSPYIALHFATNELEMFEEDGMIWAMNYVGLNRYLPPHFKTIIEREESNVFTADLLNEVSQNLDQLNTGVANPFLLFLEPPSLDYRIINQFALFSLMSDAKINLGNWLNEHEDLCFRIHIPAKLKWEIRDKLDQANITERVLFPGLQGLSMWLKRHYSSKQSQS